MSQSDATSDDELRAMLEAELDESDIGSLERERRPAKRTRAEFEEQEGNGQSVEQGQEESICPPHPGSIHGLCFRCGQPVTHQADASLALRYIHHGMQLSTSEADRIRNQGLQNILARQKLILVLDLDHTLLNTTGAAEVDSPLEERLNQIKDREQSLPQQSLYRYPSMWTKLRPFVREFLEAAHKLAELHIYTHGGREYANTMAKLLDPNGTYFGDRVISQGDSTKKHVKNLDVMLGAESAVLILDDTPGMWPAHKGNLIQVERYIYFPADAKRLAAKSCLLEMDREESDESGQLSVALRCLQQVHARFYSGSSQAQDVRIHLQKMRRTILEGVVLCFSGVIPQNVTFNPETSPLHQLASQLGARVLKELGPEVTHLVAASPGTDKARQAAQRGVPLVSVNWLFASGFLWKRMDEKLFPSIHAPGPQLKSEKEDALLAARAAGGGGLLSSKMTEEEVPI